jgi:hypothetical protein
MSEVDPQWIDAASCSDVVRVRTVNQDRQTFARQS